MKLASISILFASTCLVAAQDFAAINTELGTIKTQLDDVLTKLNANGGGAANSAGSGTASTTSAAAVAASTAASSTGTSNFGSGAPFGGVFAGPQAPVGVPLPKFGAGGGDFKGSATNIAFTPFDSKQKGTQFTTGPCTADSDCKSACCDGAKCRAPDALTPGKQSCRDGLTPFFASNGALQMVKLPAALAFTGVST